MNPDVCKLFAKLSMAAAWLIFSLIFLLLTFTLDEWIWIASALCGAVSAGSLLHLSDQLDYSEGPYADSLRGKYTKNGP